MIFDQMILLEGTRFWFCVIAGWKKKKSSLVKVEKVGTFSQVGSREEERGLTQEDFGRHSVCPHPTSGPADELRYVEWGCGAGSD